MGDDNLAPLTDRHGYIRNGVSDIGSFFGGNASAPPAMAQSSNFRSDSTVHQSGLSQSERL